MSEVVERIGKLLRLASNAAASENERSIALRRATLLMAKHKLSARDVVTKEESQDSAMYQERFIAPNDPGFRMMCDCLCDLFFCYYTYKARDEQYRPKKTSDCVYQIVGTYSDVTATRAVYDFCASSILKEAKITSLRKVRPPNEKAKFQFDFIRGATYAVAANAAILKREAERGTMRDEEGTLMPTLHNEYAGVEERAREFIINGLGLTISAPPTRHLKIDYTEGYQKGHNYGASIELQPQGKLSTKNTQRIE